MLLRSWYQIVYFIIFIFCRFGCLPAFMGFSVNTLKRLQWLLRPALSLADLHCEIIPALSLADLHCEIISYMIHLLTL